MFNPSPKSGLKQAMEERFYGTDGFKLKPVVKGVIVGESEDRNCDEVMCAR